MNHIMATPPTEKYQESQDNSKVQWQGTAAVQTACREGYRVHKHVLSKKNRVRTNTCLHSLPPNGSDVLPAVKEFGTSHIFGIRIGCIPLGLQPELLQSSPYAFRLGMSSLFLHWPGMPWRMGFMKTGESGHASRFCTRMLCQLVVAVQGLHGPTPPPSLAAKLCPWQARPPAQLGLVATRRTMLPMKRSRSASFHLPSQVGMSSFLVPPSTLAWAWK